MKKLPLLRMFFIVEVTIRVFGGLVVRDAATRRKRFIAGVDPEKIRMNLAAQKENMVEQESTYFSEIKGIEEKAKRIVEAAGVDVAAVAQYINVARQCYRVNKRFKGPTMTDEAQHIVNHWASRGYNGPLLAQVCNISGCGVSVPAPETVPAECVCGDILYCGAEGWTRLPAGVDGQLLTSHGFCKAPTWEDAPMGAVPREYFEHAHSSQIGGFPAFLDPSEIGTLLWKCPTNWKGFALVRLWFFGVDLDVDVPIEVDVFAGTCNEELYSNMDSHAYSLSLAELTLYCLEIQVELSDFLSTIKSCDLLEIDVTNNDLSTAFLFMGVEIVEASA
jgi:hypothetical protein